MPFKKGHKKIPGSGRKKGQTAMTTAVQRAELEHVIGGNIPVEMAKIAWPMLKSRSEKRRMIGTQMMKTALPYIYPSLKSVEHSGRIDGPPVALSIIERRMDEPKPVDGQVVEVPKALESDRG